MGVLIFSQSNFAFAISALVWVLFAVIWLAIIFISPRGPSIRCDFLILLFTLLYSASNYLSITSRASMSGGFFAMVRRIGDGEFLVLFLLLARGYGLTRFKLTGAEIFVVLLSAVFFYLSPIFTLAWLYYAFLYVLIVVYTVVTFSFLDERYAGLAHPLQELQSAKLETFLQMIILVLCALLLPISPAILELAIEGDEMYRFRPLINRILSIASPSLFAVAVLLLQRHRCDPSLNKAIVSSSNIYKIKQPSPGHFYAPLAAVPFARP